MDFELITGGSASIVIIGIIEILKTFGLEKKLAPVVAVVLGIGFSLVLAYYGETLLYEAIVRGLITGLSATGLYSGVKNTVEKFQKGGA